MSRLPLLLVPLLVAAAASPAASETLPSALARAYAANPTLNAERASVRATDENVPQALAGLRPRVTTEADAGIARESGRQGGVAFRETLLPRSVGLTVTQPLFDGFRTQNATRGAEAGVLGARETLLDVERQTLLDGATAYMDALRDTAALELQRNNVSVLETQVYQTRERNIAGEVTRTDVAQAEARLAAARSQVSLAEANLRATLARYRQVIGAEARQLAPGRPVDALIPRDVADAVRLGLAAHPAIRSALQAVDVAESQVKVVEGELLPSLNAVGSVQRAYDQEEITRLTAASVAARLTVPIYEGGEVYARVRQAKETVAQRRIEVEVVRDQVRAAVVAAWGQLDAAKAQVTASQAQVQANEVALNGVREEARAGQRTTLDVLNAQQELLGARVNLVFAQRDRVVSTYAVLSAVGGLSARTLDLTVARYEPKQHFDQVKGLWFGARTPDGR